MANLPYPHPESDAEPGAEQPQHVSRSGTSRWPRIAASVAALLLVVLFVVLHLTGVLGPGGH